ncbi:Uma2 family endonuclease [Synechococcus sp. PCC 7336]|uniref:Uma2 family endonuclease n=1 Tax=Synechococcus sp. PCC 7336 TaxID=195250 RepID=UPI0003455F59|nr:Uma2 family endonuclease [Synechococcus sp. PCC 7336]
MLIGDRQRQLMEYFGVPIRLPAEADLKISSSRDRYARARPNSLGDDEGVSMVQLLLEQISVPPGKSLLLKNVRWQEYESMLEELGDRRSCRIAYDRGTVELVTPLPEHAVSNRLIERFISILAEELDMPLEPYGSTTLNRADLGRGSEPDSCYYMHNQACVRNGKLDLAEGSPPDLVVEIDITHRDLNKLSLYAQIGVPEFWRFDGAVLQIFQLVDGSYREVPTSPAFPAWVTKLLFYEYLERCRSQGTTAATRLLRRQVQGTIDGDR